ncbi:hypothetical protein QUW44_05010 [Limosilactobacillus pontis]|uniref:Uncharacterized protein n=1 Tax=Limosilactobacillus pontis TaxID=35787 RepID=A0ABT7UXT5_9LACO|nr:hypothetical protein [Limosilactobacillus pontis]MDM8266520.1 hypothetical protein [Limosilactobacillus pontis]
MTITELKNALIMTGLCAGIDDIDEVVRVYESEDAERRNDWFVTIPFDALLFFHLSFDQGAAENLDLATIAAVETSISLFLMTPEEDRGISEVVSSEEEQYIIPIPGLSTTSGHQQFLTEKDGVYFSCRRNEDLHQVLTEGELNTVPSAYRDYAEPLNEYEERLCLASLGQLLGGLAHE